MRSFVTATTVRSAVLIDLNSLFHSCKRIYNRRPDYGVIVRALTCFTPRLYAFGVETGREHYFRRYLQDLGCATIFRRPKIYQDGTKTASVDVNIAIEAMKLLPDVDGIILFTNDHNLAPVITEYRNAKKFAFTVGLEISKELRERSTKYAEITPDAIDQTAVGVELLPDKSSDYLRAES